MSSNNSMKVPGTGLGQTAQLFGLGLTMALIVGFVVAPDISMKILWYALIPVLPAVFMDKPLKIVCTLGGWKSSQAVLQCYQHPNQEEMRSALVERHGA